MPSTLKTNGERCGETDRICQKEDMMKRILPLLLAAILIFALCACQTKAPAESVEPTPESPAASPDSDYSKATELTFRLLNYPLTFEREDGAEETIYLTSVTLRKNCTVITFLRKTDASGDTEFPQLKACTESGEEFVLYPEMLSYGAVCFNVSEELPVPEIIELVCAQNRIVLTKLDNYSADVSGLYTEKLNTLSTMDYTELFSYCLGSDGAYSEGAYGELAKRMTADPEEFALRMLAPVYPFGEGAKVFLDTADVTEEFYTAYGFDSKTELEICVGICSACLAPDVQQTIDSLKASGDPNYGYVADVLSEAFSMIR